MEELVEKIVVYRKSGKCPKQIIISRQDLKKLFIERPDMLQYFTSTKALWGLEVVPSSKRTLIKIV